MKEMQCFALVCNCYSGDNSVSIFWSKEDAYKAMIDELGTEVVDLENENYNFKIVEDDVMARLYVPNVGIYYEWEIFATIIR